MIQSLLHILDKNQFNDVTGTLDLKIPVTIEVANYLFKQLVDDDANDAIEHLEVIRIDDGKITFKLSLETPRIVGRKFDIVDRELILKIHPVLKAPEYILQIEVLDGIRRLENELLEILFNTLFKNESIDFENRVMLINHVELFDEQPYNKILQKLESAAIQTYNDKIIYDLKFNFN